MKLTNLLTLLCLLLVPAFAQVVGPLVHTNKNDLTIAWDANTETDLGGYEVWRSLNSTFATVGGIGPVKIPLEKVTTYTWLALPDGTYWLGVVATDTSGNKSGLSNILNYRVDTVLPVLSTPAITSITTTGAIVAWTTNEPADTQVESGFTTTFGKLSAIKPALVIVHSETLTGLLPGTLYNYRAKSTDAAGNQGVSLSFSFTTLPADITPPAPPTGFRVPIVVALTPTSSTIAWKTDKEATGFVTLYEDGGEEVKMFTANSNAYTTDHVAVLAGLTANTLHKYQAVSRNRAGVKVFSAGGSFVTK